MTDRVLVAISAATFLALLAAVPLGLLARPRPASSDGYAPTPEAVSISATHPAPTEIPTAPAYSPANTPVPVSRLERPKSTPAPETIRSWERAGTQVLDAIRVLAAGGSAPRTLRPEIRAQLREIIGQVPRDHGFHAHEPQEPDECLRLVAFDPEAVKWEHIPLRDPATLALIDPERRMATVAYLSGRATLAYPDGGRRKLRLDPTDDHLVIQLEKRAGGWTVISVGDEGSLTNTGGGASR